jgi:hypothetical protein
MDAPEEANITVVSDSRLPGALNHVDAVGVHDSLSGDKPGGAAVAQDNAGGVRYLNFDAGKPLFPTLVADSGSFDGSKFLGGFSDELKQQGKLSLVDRFKLNEAMRANIQNLPGLEQKLNESLKGTGTSIRISGDGAKITGPPAALGDIIEYTAYIKRDSKVTDSTSISIPAEARR